MQNLPARAPRYDSAWQTLLHNKLNLPYILHVSLRQKPKKPRATLVFLHGIGNNGQAWRNIIDKLPRDIRVLSIDLLGHGQSPKPQNLTYNVQVQAKAVAATLLRQRALGKVIMVGHSMGGLISIELAKRYPYLVDSLILCSPPLYGNDAHVRLPRRERQLKRFYSYLRDNPDKVPRLARYAQRSKIMNETFRIDQQTLQPFLGALEASILSQTSLDDASNLTRPFTIIHGKYDPLVLRNYLQAAVANNPFGSFTEITAHHDIRSKRYIQTVVDTIKDHVAKIKNTVDNV